MSQEFHEQHLTPPGGWFDFGWRELWERRQLLWALVGRDLQVRYKNTVLGVSWVILQPALSTLIFSLVLSSVFRFGANGPNYQLYTLVGFTFWQFFAGSLQAATGSVYEQANMIKKVYFPRAYIPLTIVFRQLFDFGVATLFFVAMMLWQGVPLTFIGLIAYFWGIFSLFLLTVGISLLVSGASVLFRDVRHLVPFVVQIWFYLTPVFYDRQLLSGKLAFLGTLNPVTLVLDGVRTGVFQELLAWQTLTAVTTLGLAVAVGGLAVFKHFETEIIDRS